MLKSDPLDSNNTIEYIEYTSRNFKVYYTDSKLGHICGWSCTNSPRYEKLISEILNKTVHDVDNSYAIVNARSTVRITRIVDNVEFPLPHELRAKE